MHLVNKIIRVNGICLLSIMLLLLAAETQAFGRTGHNMICDMSYQLVQPATRNKLDKLLQATPYQRFGPACVWPDEVRSQDEFAWSRPHHYINLQRGETKVTRQHCPEVGCVVSAIEDMQRRLQQDKTDWQALLFLSHHIADLHQPLHVSFADDLGGNRTAVYFFGEPSNLHGVWDTAMLVKLGYNEPAKQQQLFASLTPAMQQKWQDSDLMTWTNESASITIGLYQQYRPGMLIDDSYLTKHQQVLEQRLLQAAVRLAATLDALFAGKE
ncbi:endonuclease [Arsukibacterium ikkense]|uniref:Endonuclease n=1 Tax=Arsukibacterium ikkense TaxID=336831 RepID=A0A0M2VBE1_9GAMM|nr:S1/P1 nuclease [Arsukibacterium ikkense]KKO46940.1 endonuclease [Arsukibacterium ikkense]